MKGSFLKSDDDIETILTVVLDVLAWLRYAFDGSDRPPDTPSVTMEVDEGGTAMVFRVAATAGSQSLASVVLSYATQIDTEPDPPDDFQTILLQRHGDFYEGRIAIGNGVTPGNVLCFGTLRDGAGFTVSSRMYYREAVLEFCDDFVPTLEHFPRDDFPVPPPPAPDCTCRR